MSHDDGASRPGSGLRNVEINVGKRCNSRCVFCLDGRPSRAEAEFMPWDQMKGELERWRAEGYASVGFLGGEPSIYPHIVAAVAYAAELGYRRIALATNAMRLCQPRLVDELVAAGLTRVTISMHAHAARLEDRLTGVAGSFAKKCAAIAELRRHRADGRLGDGLSINAVLNGLNYRSLPKMMQFFFGELGLDDLRLNFVRPEGRATDDPEVAPPYSAVRPMVAKAVILNEVHFRKVVTFGGIPLCVWPTELLRQPPLLGRYAGELYGDLQTDCSIRAEGYDDGVSRVEGGRARFNWQERKRFDLKVQLAECGRCDGQRSCEGVWRNYLELYGGEEFAALRWEAGAFRRLRAPVTRPPRPRIAVGGVVRRG